MCNRTNTLKRKFLFIPILLLAVALASRADDKPGPCALQWKAYIDATDSERPEAIATFKKCSDTADEQKKADFVSTRDTWAASLDKLPNGGWVFLMVDDDGTDA